MVLGRNKKQLWHMTRTLLTQVVENERVYTTQAKAKLVRRQLQRVVTNAKRSVAGIVSGTHILNNTLTSQMARKKATLQLAQRFKDQIYHFTRISKVLYRRRGDNAPIVKIEFRGNEYEKSEKAKSQQIKQSQPLLNLKTWKKNFLNERKDFLHNKLTQGSEQLSQQTKKAINKAIADHDLEYKLLNRPKGDKPEYTAIK